MKEAIFDEDLPAVKLMRKWPSKSAFAAAIGRNPSTTFRYLKQGYPVANDMKALYSDIHAAAKRDGIELKPEDFVDLRLFAK